MAPVSRFLIKLRNSSVPEEKKNGFPLVLDILLIRPKLIFLKVDLKKPLSRRTQSLTTPKRSGRKVELMRTKSIMNQDNWEIIPINTFFL